MDIMKMVDQDAVVNIMAKEGKYPHVREHLDAGIPLANLE
jgi:hypothetical protein